MKGLENNQNVPAYNYLSKLKVVLLALVCLGGLGVSATAKAEADNTTIVNELKPIMNNFTIFLSNPSYSSVLPTNLSVVESIYLNPTLYYPGASAYDLRNQSVYNSTNGLAWASILINAFPSQSNTFYIDDVTHKPVAPPLPQNVADAVQNVKDNEATNAEDGGTKSYYATDPIKVYSTAYSYPYYYDYANDKPIPGGSPRPWLISSIISGAAWTTSQASAYAVDKQASSWEKYSTSAAFPSGHTMNGYTNGIVDAILAPAYAQQFMQSAALYGYYRNVLGVHYPLDVISSRAVALYAVAETLAGDLAPNTFKTASVFTLANIPTLSSSFQSYLGGGSSFASQCAGNVVGCMSSGIIQTAAQYTTAYEQNVQLLTYGLYPTGSSALPPVLPVDSLGEHNADLLIKYRFPYLNQNQLNAVLLSTELNSGGPFDNQTSGTSTIFGWDRINLYAASGGYGAFNDYSSQGVPGGDTVTVTMDKSLGGFNAFDIWSNNISGTGGLTKEGTGELVLAGNSTYAGPTNVVGGILDVTGSITSHVNVSQGATLGLYGTASTGSLINAGAVTLGGASQPAQATVNGDFTQSSTGVMNAYALSDTNYSKLTATGAATLAGTLNYNITNMNGLLGSGRVLTFDVVTANSGTLTGNFSKVNVDSYVYQGSSEDPPAIMTATISVNPTAITTASSVNNNVAGTGSANVLDGWMSSSTTSSGVQAVSNSIARMTSSQQVSNAVSQTLPILSGSTVLNSLYLIQDMTKVVESRQDALRGMSSGEKFYGNSNVWMKPFGAWISRNNANGAYGFDSSTGGLMFGGDTTLTEKLRLGGSFAWGSSSINSNAGSAAPQNQNSNLYEFIAYGSYAFRPTIDISTQISGGFGTNNSNRTISFMGTTAQGSYTSTNFHFGTSIQKRFDVLEGTTLIPSARVDYTWINNAAYSESGAGALNLNVGSQSYTAALIGTDGKIRQELFSPEHHLVSSIGVGYYVTPTKTSVTANYQGAPGTSFLTTGLQPNAVMGYGGAGYEYSVADNVQISARYDVAFQSNFANQMASLRASMDF